MIYTYAKQVHEHQTDDDDDGLDDYYFRVPPGFGFTDEIVEITREEFMRDAPEAVRAAVEKAEREENDTDDGDVKEDQGNNGLGNDKEEG